MKRILITNDDGFDAPGINKLYEALSKKYKVKVVAPATQKSACAHSITLNKPLKFIKVKKNFYKLDNGTPSDCIYLGLEALYKNKRPDLVISGINHGANVAEDITYSGTCGAAMEAVLHGIPALALSQFYAKDPLLADFTRAIKLAKKIIKKIFIKGYPLDGKKFLNVNFPRYDVDFKGIKLIHTGERLYNYTFQKNINPRGMEYFWLGESTFGFVDDFNSDASFLGQGYATITPIKLDLTAYEDMEKIKAWL